MFTRADILIHLVFEMQGYYSLRFPRCFILSVKRLRIALGNVRLPIQQLQTLQNNRSF